MANKEETATVKLVLNNAEAKRAIAELTKELTGYRKAKAEALEAGNKKGAKAYDVLIKDSMAELGKYRKSIIDVSHVLRNLNKVPLIDLQRAQSQLRKELQYLDRDTKEYRDTLEKLNRVQREVNKQGDQVVKTGSSLGATLRNMLPMASLAALPYMIQQMIAPFTQFQWMMAKVGSVSGATREEFKQLRAEAQRLGANTEYTATQVAELQLNYARLGFIPDQILKITSATLDLATATGSDLATSADVAGSTLRGFGLDASHMLRVVDVMAASFNRSALDLSTFAEAMKYVAPVAAQANISLEQTTAMLGILADRGIRGSQAGTSLKRILTEISISGKTVSEALDDLNEKGLSLASAEDEVGKYAMTALTVLANNAASIESLNVALVDSAGTAARTAATMRDNIKGDMDTFKSKLEGIAIWMGNVFNPVIRGTIQLFTWLLSPIQYLVVAVGSYLAVTKGWLLIQKGWNLAIATKNGAIASSIALTKTMTVEEMKNAIASKASTAATQLFAAAKLLLAGNTRAAAVAFKLFWASLGPIGWIALALSAAAGAMAIFSGRTKEATSASAQLALELSQERATHDDLRRAIEQSTMGTKARAETINIINERYKELLPNMLNEKMSNDEITTTLDALNSKMEENIKIRIKASEMERIQKDQLAVEQKALQELMDLYNISGDKTAEQNAQATQSFADLIIKLRESGDRAEYTAGIVKIFGLNLNTMNAAMQTNNNYGKPYNQTLAALRNTFIWVTKAANDATAGLLILNGLISGHDKPASKYAEYSIDALNASLRQVNGTLAANIMLTREGRGQLLLERDAILKEVAAREEQIRKDNTYAKTLERLQNEKKALEDQRGQTAAADKKEIARINQLIETKEREISVFSGKKGDTTTKWSLSNDQAHIAAQTRLREQLHSGEISSESEHARRLLVLQIKTLTDRIAQRKESGADLAKLEDELAEKRYQQTKNEQTRIQKLLDAKAETTTDTEKENAAYKKRLQDLELFGRTREQLTREELEALNAIETLHYQRLSSIYTDELAREIAQQQKAIERKVTAITQANNDELAGAKTFLEKKQLLGRWFSSQELQKVRTDKEADKLLKAQFAAESEAALRDDLERMIVIYQQVSDEIGRTGLLESGIAATEQDKQKITQIIDDLKKQLSELTNTPLPTLGGEGKQSNLDVLGMSVDQWDLLFQNLRDGKIGVESILSVVQSVGSAFSAVGDVISAMEARELKDYTQTQDKKKRVLDRQLKANTISQEQYSEAVQRIDDDTQAKRQEMEAQQAKRNKMLAIFQAVVNTAVGITSALGSPFPMNIVLPVIIGALGAAQIAAIAATPLPGFEDGGFVDIERQQDGRKFRAHVDPAKRGQVDGPTILVGENGSEYVVPSEGFKNPTIRPVLEIMERARKSGNIGDIDLLAALDSAGVVSGRAAGGYLSGDADSVSTPSGGSSAAEPTMSSQMAAMFTQLNRAIERLLQRLDAPIRAEVPLIGKKGIKSAEDKYNRIRNQSGI